MKRFENAQVGDEIYCRIKGNGVIKNIDYHEKYFSIICFFEKYDCHRRYTFDGRHDIYCEEPMLFYRKGSEKYLTERPEFEIDWSKVPMGTKVFTYLKKERMNNPNWNNDHHIKIFMDYYPCLEKHFWVFNNENKEEAYGYKYCKLAEPCKPEWKK